MRITKEKLDEIIKQSINSYHERQRIKKRAERLGKIKRIFE